MKLLSIVLSALAGACVPGGPAVKVDDSGVGDSPVADVVKRHWMGDPERAIADGVSALLQQQAATDGALSAEALGRLGLSCPNLTAPCTYRGHLIRTLAGLPAGSTASKVTRVEVGVEVDPRESPPRVTVRVTEAAMR
jgi:hypothetical protein